MSTTDVYLIYATKPSKDGKVTHYITAPDGSLHHTDHSAVYGIMAALLKLGWKKIVGVSLEKQGDHYIQRGTMTMTPPTKASLAAVAKVKP